MAIVLVKNNKELKKYIDQSNKLSNYENIVHYEDIFDPKLNSIYQNDNSTIVSSYEFFKKYSEEDLIKNSLKKSRKSLSFQRAYIEINNDYLEIKEKEKEYQKKINLEIDQYSNDIE